MRYTGISRRKLDAMNPVGETASSVENQNRQPFLQVFSETPEVKLPSRFIKLPLCVSALRLIGIDICVSGEGLPPKPTPTPLARLKQLLLELTTAGDKDGPPPSSTSYPFYLLARHVCAEYPHGDRVQAPSKLLSCSW